MFALNGFPQAEREIFGHGGGVHISTEHSIPEAESGAEVFAALEGGGVMDAVVVRRDDEPFERADVDGEICVFPKLDEKGERITDAGFSRAEFKKGHWYDDLWEIVNEGVEEAGAESGEPIHVLDGVMPGVGAPKEIEPMLGAVNPIDQKIGDEEGHDDFPKAGEALEKVERCDSDGWGEIADEIAN